jgi:hypothetical protein
MHIVDMSRIKFLFATQGLDEKAIFPGSHQLRPVETMQRQCIRHDFHCPKGGIPC